VGALVLSDKVKVGASVLSRDKIAAWVVFDNGEDGDGVIFKADLRMQRSDKNIYLTMRLTRGLLAWNCADNS
jgi:hypothetical protein